MRSNGMKIVILLMLLFCLSACATLLVSAEAEELWAYEPTEGGVILTEYCGAEGVVDVPDVLLVHGIEYKVIGLADGLFENNDTVTHVTLGNGIAVIGDRAFYDADALVEVRLSRELTDFGAQAFADCDALTSLTLGDNVTDIGQNAFADCPALTVSCREGSATHATLLAVGITFDLTDGTSGLLAGIDSIVYCIGEMPQVFVSEYAPMAADTTVDYWGRQALAKLSNGDLLVRLYDLIYAGVARMDAKINLYDGYTSITKSEVWTAFSAYRWDHSEHFWLDGGYTGWYNYESYLSIDPIYVFDAASLPSAKAAFEAEVSEILSGITDDMTDFEKELYLHEAVVKRVTYVEAANAHNPYGALIEGLAVCEGYAEALQYLLHRCGIPSVIVTGGNHAWNAVMIDGEWYQVDATWNDGGNMGYHAYFNQTTAVMLEEHQIESNGYEWPLCTATEANYFKVMGGWMETYTVDSVAMRMKDNAMVGYLYLPTQSTSDFWQWFQNNIRMIASKLGVQGAYQYGSSYMGRERRVYIVPTSNPDGGIPSATFNFATAVSPTVNMTLTLQDDRALAGYYWGRSAVYTDNSYVSLDTITTRASAAFAQTDSGIYYLTVKDVAGNVSQPIVCSFVKTTLDACGGTGIVPSVLRVAPSYAGFTIPTPTREGYTLLGWSTKPQASEIEYEVGGYYKGTIDATLYAVWQHDEPGILYGDANGDGKISAKDILRIRKYLANYDYVARASTVEIYVGADANGDDVINGKDVLILRKYLANYNYDTGKSSILLGPVA